MGLHVGVVGRAAELCRRLAEALGAGVVGDVEWGVDAGLAGGVGQRLASGPALELARGVAGGVAR